MTAHTHECTACHEHYLCSAPLERNDDGWPNPVCVTRMEADLRYQQCTLCNDGKLLCDSGCGRRGTWNDDLGETQCDDCAQNQAEAAHERRLESPSVSIAELSERAYAERAELRRRD